MEPDRQRRDMRGLTDRAKANRQRRERKETHEDKRIRLAKGEKGTRRVSERPEHRPGGGEWELPPGRTDITARELIGGQDGRGRQRVFKEEAMDIAHEEKYAGHPILRLFTRPEEMENGTYMHLSKEDVAHMNTWPRMEQKRGELRIGGDAKAVGHHIWRMARTGLGRDPRNKKEGGVGTTEKAGSQTRTNGQNAGNRTRGPQRQTGRLGSGGRSGTLRHLRYIEKDTSTTRHGKSQDSNHVRLPCGPKSN
eukprot:130375-Pleurochrysis_carterae.AAC.1